jgi:hypothetical protein
MKWKLQGPSLARTPSNALAGAIEMPYKFPEMLELIYETDLIKVFPYWPKILKIYMTLPITSCKAARNFYDLSVIKKRISINHAAGKK